MNYILLLNILEDFANYKIVISEKDKNDKTLLYLEYTQNFHFCQKKIFNENLQEDEKENDLLDRGNYRNSENNLKRPKGVLNIRKYIYSLLLQIHDTIYL